MPQLASDNDGHIFDAAMNIVALWGFNELTTLDAKFEQLNRAIALVKELLAKNRERASK